MNDVELHKLQEARMMWLYIYDILRDKSEKTLTIQEAIDVASEAYKLYTGESIQNWFTEDTIAQPQ